MTFNDARFNQDGSCICVANDKGFKILNSNPMVVTCERDLRYKQVGSIGIAEMLYRSNLLALVGNSEYYDIRKNSLTSLRNKFIKPWKQNILTIWDDKKLVEVAQLVFNDSIINIKLLYDLLVVVLKHKVYTYQMSDVSLVNCTNTSYNHNGICSAASYKDMNIIAFPGKIKGTIILEIYTKYVERPEFQEQEGSFVEIPKTFEDVIDVFEFKNILECGEKAGKYSRVSMKLHVHASEITSIDLSPNGLLLVTSSLGGRFIKMFDTLSGELIQVFIKSRNFGKVTKCCIDKDMTWLSVITQKPKMYLYELDQEAVSDCEFGISNRRIDYKNSCIFDINNEETDIGRYFKYYKYSIMNPPGKCGELNLCRKLISGVNLFINSTYSVLSFVPRNKEKLIACSFFIEKETIVVIFQSGKAMKLFFNPSKSGKLKTLFYHNL